MLDKDLHCTGTALTMSGFDVVLNLNGHTISGNGTGFGVDITDEGSNQGFSGYRVVDGVIKDFSAGIAVGYGWLPTSSQYAPPSPRPLPHFPRATAPVAGPPAFSHLTVTGNGTGLEENARGVEVVNSVFRDNKTALLMLTEGGVFDHDEFLNNHSNTLFASQLPFVTFSYDLISGSSTGLQLDQTFNAHLDHNEIAGDGQGVLIYDLGSSGAVIEQNNFLANSIGLQLGEASGADEVQGTTVEHNAFTANGSAGLYVPSVLGTARGSVITHNVFAVNGWKSQGSDSHGQTVDDGVLVDATGSFPGGFTLSDNFAYANRGYGVYAPGVVDGGGNRAAANAGPTQCVGVVCS